MLKLVKDQFGGDAALIEAVQDLQAVGADALAHLEATDMPPRQEHFAALEAIVAFDGTRPSFLVRHDEADLFSSWSTSSWKTLLAANVESLATLAACVGRLELRNRAVGTAFLVAPRLAITNRHVAQALADFTAEGSRLKPDVCLDFGREHHGRNTYDRRQVTGLVAWGRQPIEGAPDHSKLDIALMALSASTLKGGPAERALKVRMDELDLPEGSTVIALGYPGDWRRTTPTEVRGRYGKLIARLLKATAGVKRLAPGRAGPMLDAATCPAGWTTTHDATTISGNSGSPLASLGGGGSLSVRGVHYGGRWGGGGANWAHLLARCADEPCAPGGERLIDLLGYREVR